MIKLTSIHCCKYLYSTCNFVVVHVSRDCVKMFLVREDVDPRVADDVADVPDQDGEDEDPHQPGVNVTFKS